MVIYQSGVVNRFVGLSIMLLLVTGCINDPSVYESSVSMENGGDEPDAADAEGVRDSADEPDIEEDIEEEVDASLDTDVEDICTSPTVEDFCTFHAVECGALNETDSCGVLREEVCGPCVDGNICDEGLCLEATCEDEVQNQDETDVDCGGSCRGCLLDQSCQENSDCSRGQCEANSCVPARSSDGLVALYTFSEGAGEVVEDRSGDPE